MKSLAKTFFVLVAAALLIRACVNYSDKFEIVCAHTCKVKEIGGCDRRGYCGVQCTDGKFSELFLPVKGQAQCDSKINRRIKP